MTNSSALRNKEAQYTQYQKIYIPDGFRRKEKTTAIFFDIEKSYDKVNGEKTFWQLENMRIKGWMMNDDTRQ